MPELQLLCWLCKNEEWTGTYSSCNLDGGYLAIVVDFVQYIMMEKRENKVDVNQYGVMGDIHIALLGKKENSCGIPSGRKEDGKYDRKERDCSFVILE